MTAGSDDYLAAEAKARVDIDRALGASGWIVQNADAVDLRAGRGVAVHEFVMEKGHGRADYLLFVDETAVGSIEAKPAGTTLTGVEFQSAKYTSGIPAHLPAPIRPLPFAYESTGVETRFTNGLDPEPRSREVFTFHRPGTLADWVRDWERDPSSVPLTSRHVARSKSPNSTWTHTARSFSSETTTPPAAVPSVPADTTVNVTC